MGTKIIKSGMKVLGKPIRFANLMTSLLLFIMLTFLFVSPVISQEYLGNLVRVGITDNKFQNVLRSDVTIYATAEAEICDKLTRKSIYKIPANTDIKIRNGISGLDVTIQNTSASIRDFVIVSPQGLLGIRGLARKGKQALYHGAFEIVQNENKTGFFVVNIVELQEYLKGVVPNEMPVRFGLEALKAQAVAARNYVLTPRVQSYKEFNVVDSVASQVYFGYNTEDDLATQAVMETDGIVALYDNELILALYSSTAGGYTENYEYAFSDPNTKMFPSEHRPYLVAVPDRKEFPTLESEEKARDFYLGKVPSFDIGELENILKQTLIAQSQTGFVYPSFKQGDDLGKIKDIKVMRRGTSGKAIEVEIMTTKNCYRVAKELVIRRVFQKDGISLPSANFVVDKTLDSYGNITDIKITGGGFGHGVGMSQFGAGYMATKLKQPYYNILRHYYTDINLGTVPITVSGEETKQTFWAPIGRAQLVITNANTSKLALMVNGKELEFPVTKTIFQKDYKIDISRYIEDGANTIIFYPPEQGRAVTLYVELVEKYATSQED